MTLHEILDFHFGLRGDDLLKERLDAGEKVHRHDGPFAETPLHVAVRRRRLGATRILLDYGADVDAQTAGGKTAYAHAIRRGFTEIATLLAERGADTTLNDADRFTVAVVEGRMDDARTILQAHPGVIRTGNPEEDRLLADVSGRSQPERVAFLIEAGADLMATALDDGTPLHQAAWFGQPECVRLLLDAGAPLEVFDGVHHSSPLGWAVHGSRNSGSAEERQDVYVDITRMLLAAGAKLHYPGEPESDAYFQRMLDDATPDVRVLLEESKR